MPPARPASAPPGAPPQSRRRCLSPRRRAAAPPAPAPLRAPARAQIVRARESWLDGLLRLCALLERVRRLGRHVVLVVLGEHLARGEHAVGAKLALRHHALAFAE